MALAVGQKTNMTRAFTADDVAGYAALGGHDLLEAAAARGAAGAVVERLGDRHARAAVVVYQRVQEVLHGQVGMATNHGLPDRRLDGELQLAVDPGHSSSTPARNG